MNTLIKTTMVAIAFSLMVTPALADGVTPTVLASVAVDSASLAPSGAIDKGLELKAADFASFAKTKVQQLNRNHRFSRSRMEITKQPDGTFRARYHQIDDSSLSTQVRRSRSASIPFVGVLSYREQVFESSAKTPDQFDQSLFALVEVVPNRHIFSYQKGTWN